MAVYDGFFDAVADEETGEFDRAYGSEDFTDCFAHIIGTGVCIHNDPDSFKVRFENGNAVVSPGYLFIQGYWLKNDSDYAIPVTGTATLAIAAHLNLGKRMIEMEAQNVAQAYPDSLVLALVNPAAGTVEDTRHNTDLCGIIDTAGELSQKVEWAVNYIDNEIEGKLAAAEEDIAEQSKRLDAKIAEVQAQVNKISPPPVGTIQFSASQDVGPEWLLCNGDFISESQYPELVAALGKLTPSGDKFKLLSDGEIGTQISNGVLYDGRMWVYSYSTKKLYGVDVEGTEPVKEISVTSDNEYFSNFIPQSTSYPLCLSIIPHKIGTGAKLFLAQFIDDISLIDTESHAWLNSFPLFQAEFTGNEELLKVESPFDSFPSIGNYSLETSMSVPYVVSIVDSSVEKYLCVIGMQAPSYNIFYIKFCNNECSIYDEFVYGAPISNQRFAIRDRDKNECVFISKSGSGSTYFWHVKSFPNGVFEFNNSSMSFNRTPAESVLSINVVGSKKILSGFTINSFLWFSHVENKFESVSHGLKLPSPARIFVDAGIYLWGKDIYMIFVGTGIIFSRTLEEGSFGYLDTTSVLGTITQFGYLDYSQDEGTLYLVGQDTTNTVKVAKIVLNALYDYANDGAWLPMIASDGVPAYIKAKETSGGVITDPVEIEVTVTNGMAEYTDAILNGKPLFVGSYTRTVSKDGTFTVGVRVTSYSTNMPTNAFVKINGVSIGHIRVDSSNVGKELTKEFKSSDFLTGGVTISIS